MAGLNLNNMPTQVSRAYDLCCMILDTKLNYYQKSKFSGKNTLKDCRFSSSKHSPKYICMSRLELQAEPDFWRSISESPYVRAALCVYSLIMYFPRPTRPLVRRD